MFPSMRKNPYIAMLSVSWQYARNEKGRFLLIYGMFLMANILTACYPFIWGWFINKLQRQGIDGILASWKYVGIYLLIHFLDWFLHGRARVMERKLAFNLSRNYLQDMYHKTLHLPVGWHQDNHSGATINRIRKAYEAIKDFFENGFMYFHALSKFLSSFIAMVYFAPLSGLAAIVLGAFAIWTILRFDRPFLKALNETNEKEHQVSSNLFDSLSNIISVITLRLEKRMEKSLLQKVGEVFPPFRRKVVINEWKWFTVDTIVAMIYGVILLGYMYQNWSASETFMIGTLVTLVAYVERFTSVFHDIAWQYTRIISYYAEVQTASNITEAYANRHLPDLSGALPPDWRRLEIEQLNFSHDSPGGQRAPTLDNLRI